MDFLQDNFGTSKHLILVLSTLTIATTSLLLIALVRLAEILPGPSTPSTSTPTAMNNTPLPRRPPTSAANPTHLLIVLGSGGHTAEMLNILSTTPDLSQLFTQRTYLVSSGDDFSASKAATFEKDHISKTTPDSEGTYTIVTVRRARRVHQSFLSTPMTTILSLWDCISVLRGSHPDTNTTHKRKHIYPDLIITNGPGTGVCVVLAALLLRFFGFSGPSATAKTVGQGQMRTVFVESWARVKTLSLSGQILQPLVNRFLVQWPQLAEREGVEYLGPLVS